MDFKFVYIYTAYTSNKKSKKYIHSFNNKKE